MGQLATGHVPVGLERFVELAGPALTSKGAIFVDATLGMGGHAESVAAKFDQVSVIGLDRDPAAVALVHQRLDRFGQRVKLFQANFSQLGHVLAEAGIGRIDAALFDLGVSSYQLDQDSRGFAYSRPTPLDMRMDPDDPVTAADILAAYSEADLAKIFFRYGQERFASSIAKAIVRHRQTRPIETSDQLVELIRGAIPEPAKRHGGHPAKRVFQALRMAVNGELEAIQAALPQAISQLRIGGRIVVMSYQSLEDQAVKQILARGLTNRTPVGLPVEREEDQPYLKALTKGAELAGEAEQLANPRSTSLRLRAVEKIGEVA